MAAERFADGLTTATECTNAYFAAVDPLAHQRMRGMGRGRIAAEAARDVAVTTDFYRPSREWHGQQAVLGTAAGVAARLALSNVKVALTYELADAPGLTIESPRFEDFYEDATRQRSEAICPLFKCVFGNPFAL